MRRRMLAAALACTLLAGCGPVRTEPVEQETPGRCAGDRLRTSG
ncbi:MAG: hypothetical protein ACLTYN_03450 [Dysosmobacter welbionis]